MREVRTVVLNRDIDMEMMPVTSCARMCPMFESPSEMASASEADYRGDSQDQL